MSGVVFEQEICRLTGEGKLGQALEMVAGMIDREQETPRYYEIYGDLLESRGDLKEALVAFSRASELDSHNPDYLYREAEIQLMLYNVGEAIDLCRRGRRKFPGDYRFVMVEADAWLWSIPVKKLAGDDRQDALDRAWKLLNHAISLKPENGEIRVVEATAYLQEQNLTRCRGAFENALNYGVEIFGDYVDVCLCLAILYIRTGNLERGEKYIDLALDYFWKWKQPHYLKLMLFGEHLLMLREVYFDKFDSHDEMMDKIYREYQDMINRGFRVHFLSREIRQGVLEFFKLRRGNDPGKATEILEQLLTLFDGKLPLCIIFHTIKQPSLKTLFHIYLGDMYRRLGRSEEARSQYRKALDISPGDPAARARLRETDPIPA